MTLLNDETYYIFRIDHFGEYEQLTHGITYNKALGLLDDETYFPEDKLVIFKKVFGDRL